MKESVSNFPFAVYAETKTSQKTGNQYNSISVAFSSKDKDGKKTTTYFNFFDERDLLVLASLCSQAYEKIRTADYNERFGNKEQKKEVEEQPKTEGAPNDDLLDDSLDGVFG